MSSEQAAAVMQLRLRRWTVPTDHDRTWGDRPPAMEDRTPRIRPPGLGPHSRHDGAPAEDGPGPVHCRDRAVPPRAVGALLPHGRLSARRRGSRAGNVSAGVALVRRIPGRASIRTWLYTIATNVCLTALQPRQIRVLPSGLTGRTTDTIAHRGTSRPARSRGWNRCRTAGSPRPPTIRPPRSFARESLRLALIASLQHLPARQRAILILCEVLVFSAAETADILGTTTAAVKSGLQRGPRSLGRTSACARRTTRTGRPTGAGAARWLHRSLRTRRRQPAGACAAHRCHAGSDALPRLAGRPNQLHQHARRSRAGHARRRRMIPTTANRQPAAAVYRRDEGGTFEPTASWC